MWTSGWAPSAVWTRLMASWALRVATFRPPICERRLSERTSPDGSSAGRLMRNPDDSRSRERVSRIWFIRRLR